MTYVTRVSYVVAPDQREFDITFPYLEPSHVEVLLSSVPLPWAAYEWVSEKRIRLHTDPGAGNTVTLRRRTPLDHAIVKFHNGAVLTEDELNKAVLQVLYNQQEIVDLYVSTLEPAKVRLGDNLGIVTNPEAIMDELVGMVLADELLADLSSRLADVNRNATSIIEEALRGHKLKLGVNVIRDQVKTLETDSEKMAAVLDLLTIVATDGQSLVLREDKVYRGNGRSLAQTFVDISTEIDGAKAYAEDLRQTIVGPEGALTRLRESLGAYGPGGAGFILNDLLVKRTNGETLAQSFSGLTSRMGTAEAAIISNQEAIATETTARAQAVSTLSATVGNHTSSITNLQSVQAGLSAKAGLALDVNGYTTGWILNNNGSSGSMTIIANRFAVVDPNQGSPIVPFEVEAGWLKAPRIRAGDVYANTITTNHLIVGGVTTDKIANNAVTNGASAFNGGTVSVSPGGTAQLGAVGLTTGAGRVQLHFSCCINPITFSQGGDPASQRNILWYDVRRDGSTIGTFLAQAAVLTGGSMLVPGGLTALVFSDAPGAGSHTYEVYGRVTSTAGLATSVSFSTLALNVQESKK